jgi:hypothetical protein
MRLKTMLLVLSGLFCAVTSGMAFVEVVPKVRAVDALTLFASAFGAGASLSIAVYQARHKKQD